MSLFSQLPPAIKVDTAEHAQQVLAYYMSKKLVAFDTETTGLRRGFDYAVLLSLSDGVQRHAIWPECLNAFKPLLENPNIRLIGHNVNFDQWMLLTTGIDTDRYTQRKQARMIDTMVMHALLHDDDPHDLKFLARRYLDIDMVPFKQLYGAQMRTRSLTDIFLDPANEAVTVNYSSLDAYATYKLFLRLQTELVQTTLSKGPFANLWNYYVATEIPFTKVLWHMEREGVQVNIANLINRAPQIDAEITNARRWFSRQTRRLDINLNSVPQMSKLFFEDLGYTPISYTKDNKPKLDKYALKVWAKKGCQYATNLLKYRDMTKRLGTNVIGLIDKVHADGKVHATFVQTGAKTGRLAARDPNLQNQPPEIRDAYEADEGYVLRAADYAQLEMRILAHVSGEPALIDAINNGRDVHSATAAVMYGMEYEPIAHAKERDDRGEVLTDEEKGFLKLRKGAKSINFGIMYGMGANKLAGELGISKDEAQGLIDRYFAALPNVPKYFEEVIAEARVNGYCSTLFGRRRQLSGIWSPLSGERSRAERQVKNAPIQGFASEITKMAMIAIWNDDELWAAGFRMLLQVHDEIVFKLPIAQANNVYLGDKVLHHMSTGIGMTLAVPLETSGKTARTWAGCK